MNDCNNVLLKQTKLNYLKLTFTLEDYFRPMDNLSIKDIDKK